MCKQPVSRQHIMIHLQKHTEHTEVEMWVAAMSDVMDNIEQVFAFCRSHINITKGTIC